jgi:hypothetical protein
MKGYRQYWAVVSFKYNAIGGLHKTKKSAVASLARLRQETGAKLPEYEVRRVLIEREG